MTYKECNECNKNNCAYKMAKRPKVGDCAFYRVKKQTNLEWIKDPNTTAEQVVDFIRSLCTEAAKDQWCDAFDGDCRSCMAAYLMAEKKES